MVTSNIKTPGVYIDEVNAFPNSVVPVATAVPAFIGYTPTAEYQGKSYFNKAQKITSFAEFQSIYMNGNPPPPADPATQYSPEYYLVEQKEKPTTGDYLMISGSYYSIVPDPSSIYYLYNSVRLFYQNGGGDAYIVSIGTYGPSSGKAGTVGEQIVNPNVQLSDLKNGLDLLQYEQEPTIYICPEATLLSVADNGTLMQEMLLQAGSMQTAVCMFDVIGGNTPDPITYTNDIETFRNNTGSNSLNYGVAYYPFIGTTIMQSSEINYTNLFGGDVKQLEPLLNPASAPNPTASKIISMIEADDGSMTTSQLNAALLNASQTYAQIVNHVLTDANLLPPSGGMAGVYTVNDNVKGVWGAPANTSIVGASTLPIRLNDTQQAGLNVDAVSGKSINAIRFFNGQGILVWGARTLDGNSQDWRYISVRRTMTFLEQSCKLAARAYVFAANDVNTWGAVKSEIGSFLMSIWKEGGLQGSKASDAFQVECGLGTTMTSDDILNGFMKVSVKVAITHPAEFIVISFEQEMAKSG
ncbi:phage tail sheath family protein [Pseudoalteromonas sp. JBTF-M23]|uniref:Phage tail sheath family protein n=1 Tax=Pseudoalteromonas caenipelagi TaxID=2726988 RepID=A0A849VEC9_9GAMM|nr:phage tail sheath C-terminal domain-containing protein [Pseudoalteromonas caenipelagi]NOU50294.1 phage tail sheath family protein [Pseudoalteromonas caenipelagi]